MKSTENRYSFIEGALTPSHSWRRSNRGLLTKLAQRVLRPRLRVRIFA
jgi:hypothetical protein